MADFSYTASLYFVLPDTYTVNENCVLEVGIFGMKNIHLKR